MHVHLETCTIDKCMNLGESRGRQQAQISGQTTIQAEQVPILPDTVIVEYL